MILGAFLHDVGHLVGKEKKLEDMVTDGVIIGTQDHDKVGEDFLKDLGRLLFISYYSCLLSPNRYVLSVVRLIKAECAKFPNCARFSKGKRFVQGESCSSTCIKKP